MDIAGMVCDLQNRLEALDQALAREFSKRAQTEESRADAERLLWLIKDSGLGGLNDVDFLDAIVRSVNNRGEEEPSDEDYLAAVRECIDAARAPKSAEVPKCAESETVVKAFVVLDGREGRCLCNRHWGDKCPLGKPTAVGACSREELAAAGFTVYQTWAVKRAPVEPLKPRFQVNQTVRFNGGERYGWVTGRVVQIYLNGGMLVRVPYTGDFGIMSSDAELVA